MNQTQSGWFLRHRDGIEHGPFQDADIIAAAKLGNLADDTCVKHETKTLDQWVFAARVQAIAAVMKKAAQQSNGEDPSSVKPQNRDAQATRAAIDRPRDARTQANPTPGKPTREKRVASGMTRQPVEQAVATKARESSFTKQSPTEKRQPSQEAPDSEPQIPAADRVIRTRRDAGYPVPRTFLDACISLVDFRFRSFVTPWIVKILWALCVVAAMLWIGRLGYESFIQGEVSATAAATTLGASGEWEFTPLRGQPFLQTPLFQFLVAAGTIMVSVLCLRVFCEAAIVLLRVATDIHELNSQAKSVGRD